MIRGLASAENVLFWSQYREDRRKFESVYRLEVQGYLQSLGSSRRSTHICWSGRFASY